MLFSLTGDNNNFGRKKMQAINIKNMLWKELQEHAHIVCCASQMDMVI